MPRFVKYSIVFFILGLVLCAQQKLGAQNWRPDMDGLHPVQGGYPDFFNVKFKSNLMGKDWIYGTWLDEDSVRRCVAYREGGKWVALPISFSNSSCAKDIEVHGDTMLIVGDFTNFKRDIDTNYTFGSGFLKWWNDSLWLENRIILTEDISVSNDSILVWGNYIDTSFIRYGHNLSVDGGKTWIYPYSIIHPTEPTASFGANAGLQIHNGQIYTINSDSPANDSAGWKGVVRWDGSQWHAYPYGMWGGFARASAFEFYKGELYMGGSFSKASHPNNPGTGIARWNGTQWNDMGGGVGNFVQDLFVHNNLLFCNLAGTGFADAPISYFASWDGDQWCGTPANFARPALSFGFAHDTLFCVFNEQSTTIDNDTVTHMNYFVGDYVYGPDAICSTYGLGGAEEIAAPTQTLLVYPNPTNASVTITLPQEFIRLVEVIDINGKVLIIQKINEAVFSTTVDLSGLPAGMYFLKVNHSYFAKVSKQ